MCWKLKLNNLPQKDFEKAFPLAVKACGAGVLNSCVNVSVMYRNGDGVPVDHKKADEYVGLAKEIVRQMQDATRLTFQEGVESAEWSAQCVWFNSPA